jgi:hypothetical protein
VPLIALLLVLAAPARAEDPSIADGSAQAALDAARGRWQERGFANYRFRQALRCFCPAEYGEWRRIMVRRRRPVDPPDHLRRYASVPRLFRLVQDAIDERAAVLVARYGRTGLPRRIWIDYDERVADEELGVDSSRLRPR